MPEGDEATARAANFSARDVLAVAARHGVVVRLEAGRAMMRADTPPPAAVIALLRQHRDAVAALLASPAPEQDLAPARPDHADYWLTHDAVTLAGILNTGGTARICPNGGIDAWDAAGLYRGFSPDLVRRLRAAGLLPNMEGVGGSISGDRGPRPYEGNRAQRRETATGG